MVELLGYLVVLVIMKQPEQLLGHRIVLRPQPERNHPPGSVGAAHGLVQPPTNVQWWHVKSHAVQPQGTPVVPVIMKITWTIG